MRVVALPFVSFLKLPRPTRLELPRPMVGPGGTPWVALGCMRLVQSQESQTEGLNGQCCHVKYLYDSTKV